MQAVKTSRADNPPNINRYFLFSAALVILALIGVYFFNAYSAYRARFLPSDTQVINQIALEEKYGLRVNLVAVTAAGGMLDVRLKILDSGKAKTLLQDSKNYPALFINGKTLTVPDETKKQAANMKDGDNLFMLFSNVGNSIRSGDPVTIVFGKVALEPIPAK